MNKRQIIYQPAHADSAREFLQWQYEPPYDVYNCPPDYLEESIWYNTDPVNNIYAMFDQHGELVGYCSFGNDARVAGGDYSQAALDIGLMIKPDLTGRGLGADFARDVIKYGIEQYAPQKLRVTIAAFNLRAIRTWEKLDFRSVQSFRRSMDGLEFIVMIKELP